MIRYTYSNSQIWHVAAVCVLILLSSLYARPIYATSVPTLLVLGDSISAGYGINPERGWVRLLQNRLGAKARVVNGSISGNTSADGLLRLPGLLEKTRPSMVIIELGGNDGLRGYPVALLKKNLAGIIAQSRAAGAEVLLLEMRIPPNYGKRYSEQFQRSFTEVSTATSVTLVPFLLEELALVAGMMQADGIHPSESAQSAMLEKLWPYVQNLLR